MQFIINLLVSAVAVLLSAYLLPGVHVDGFISALVVAIVLAILNAILKPILVVLTIPITILTLGLFLLVINVIVIYAADALIGGFRVDGFLWALVFSFVLSLISSVLGGVVQRAS